MRKLTLIFLVFSLSGYGQAWKSYYTVPNKVTRFGVAIPVNQVVFEADSNAFYKITRLMNATDSMATVFRGSYYTEIGGSSVDLSAYAKTDSVPVRRIEGTIVPKTSTDTINFPVAKIDNILNIGYDSPYRWGSASILRAISGSYASGWHGFEDISHLTLTGGTLAYAAFASTINIDNATTYDHLVGFQCANSIIGNANLGRYNSFVSMPYHAGGGVITDMAGMKIYDVTGAGGITNNYGIYIDPLTRGGTNYGIYSAGSKVKFIASAADICATFWGGNGGYNAIEFSGDNGTTTAAFTTNSNVIYFGKKNGTTLDPIFQMIPSTLEFKTFGANIFKGGLSQFKSNVVNQPAATFMAGSNGYLCLKMTGDSANWTGITNYYGDTYIGSTSDGYTVQKPLIIADTGTIQVAMVPNSTSDTLLVDSCGVPKKRLGAIDNWNEAYGWGNHASAGYLSNPITTSGDMIYGDAGDPFPTRLAVGTTGQIIRSKLIHLGGLSPDYNIPEWATPGTAIYQDTATAQGWKVSGGNTIQRLGGNVGIGTTAPATELQVASTATTSPRGIMSSQHSASTDGARLHLRKSRGTNVSPSVITSGDMLGKIVASGFDGSNYLEMASIDFSSTGTIGSTRVPTYISFSTATDAAPSVLTERMRITAAGNVGIGTTAPTKLLHVNGTSYVSSLAYFGNDILGDKLRPYTTAGDLTLQGGTSKGILFNYNAGTTGMYLMNGGNLGIGTTAPTNKLDVNGYTRLRNKVWVGDSTGTYSYVNPGDASFTTSSSREWKRNITDIPKPDSLFDKVLFTNPKTYQFKPSMYAHDIPRPVDSTLTDEEINVRWQELKKADSIAAEIQASKIYKGFIAEDINQRFLGTDSKELNYTDILITLWQTTQELILQNQNLDSRMRTVEYRLNELEKR